MKENLLNLIGWRKYKNKRNKGYTLVEVVICICISSIVLSVGMSIIIKNLNIFKDSINVNIRNDNLDDAMITIDRILKENMIKEINIQEGNLENGKIEVVSLEKFNTEKTIKKTIMLDNIERKIVLITSKNNINLSTNIVLRNVSEFNIIKKENISYIYIGLLNGERRIQCL